MIIEVRCVETYRAILVDIEGNDVAARELDDLDAMKPNLGLTNGTVIDFGSLRHPAIVEKIRLEAPGRTVIGNVHLGRRHELVPDLKFTVTLSCAS